MKMVLYIDAEAKLEKMASKFKLLKDEGIDVIQVTRLKDVMPTIQKLKGSIGLIILDIVMPPDDYYTLDETNGGMTTGLKLLGSIRNTCRDVPIIIVSMKRKKQVLEKDLSKYNILGYREKPISASVLLRAIKQALAAS